MRSAHLESEIRFLKQQLDRGRPWDVERAQRLRRFARLMRSDPTVGERILWRELRAHRFEEVEFRRQSPTGPFLPDFSCYSHRLVIEVDGDSHTMMAKDRQRDAWFKDNGWTVLRFWDDDVIHRLSHVLDTIHEAVRDPSAVEDPLNEHAHPFLPFSGEE